MSDVVGYQLDQLLGESHVRLQAGLVTASESFDRLCESLLEGERAAA